MTLASLSLRHFRNHQKLKLEFSPTVTVLVGPNASGKTNILEAINYLATTHSFKTRTDKEVIKFGEEVADILAKVGDEVLSLIISSPSPSSSFSSSSKKSLQINKVPKNSTTFLGHLRAVIFRPEDIDLLTDGPSLRRDFLDSILIQTNPVYAHAHTLYHKVISRRNRILGNKEITLTTKLSELAYWNEELLKNGQIVQTTRQDLINNLNNCLPNVIENLFPLSPLSPLLSLIYLPNLLTPERLAGYQDAELASGLTLIGPQRDDFEISQDGKNLAAYGSRGEQRTAVLALKLSELEYVTKTTNDKPLLLLDDIFSELDESHRAAVLNVIQNQQTILTTTEPHDFDFTAKIVTLPV